MTTAGPDRPLTAADLLFGSSADAPEALAKQIVSIGRGQNLGRVLTRLPRLTQEAAIREAAATEVPGSEHPSNQLPGSEHPSTQLSGSEHPSGQVPASEHPGSQLPGSEHPGSSEADHSSAPWWEKPHPDSASREVS